MSNQFAIAQSSQAPPEYKKLLNNSFQDKWSYFELEDTLEATIIKHEKQEVGCGSFATASLSIVKTNNDDTLRILDLCNYDYYEKGTAIRVSPMKDVQGQVRIPNYVLISGEIMNPDKKKRRKKVKRAIEPSIYRSNEFDETILKTTWGIIEEKNE